MSELLRTLRRFNPPKREPRWPYEAPGRMSLGVRPTLRTVAFVNVLRRSAADAPGLAHAVERRGCLDIRLTSQTRTQPVFVPLAAQVVPPCEHPKQSAIYRTAFAAECVQELKGYGVQFDVAGA